MTYYIQNPIPVLITLLSFSVMAYVCCLFFGGKMYKAVCGHASHNTALKDLTFKKSAVLILLSCGLSAFLFTVFSSDLDLMREILLLTMPDNTKFIPCENLYDLTAYRLVPAFYYLLVVVFVVFLLITFLSVFVSKKFNRFHLCTKSMMYTLSFGIVFFMFFTTDIEAANVSSLSWFFLVLFLLSFIISIRMNYRMIMGHINPDSFILKHLLGFIMGCILLIVMALAPSTDFFVEAHEHFDRATDHYEKNQHKQAFIEYCKAIDKDPDLINAYFNRGSMYFDNKQYVDALMDFRDYLDLKEDDPEAYYFAGQCLKFQGHHLGALKIFSKAIQYKPDDPWFYELRGSIYLRLGLYHSAIHDMNESIRIKPDESSPFEYRAYLHFLTGHYESAIEDYTQVITHDPQDVEATVMRFLCEKKLGQHRYPFPGNLDLSTMDGTATYIVRMVEGTLSPEEALSLIDKQMSKDRYMVNLAYACAGELYVIEGETQKAISIFNIPDVFAYPNWVYYMAQKELSHLTPSLRS